MKHIPLMLLFVFALFVNSCGVFHQTYHSYYKCFYIAETSFEIEGEIFVNDKLTAKGDFDRIAVRLDSVRNWEIEGLKKTENKFTLTVNTTANGITLSKDSIVPDKEEDYFFSRFPEGFPYCTLIFYVDGRRAKHAIEPEFGAAYYYVYVSESINLSETVFQEINHELGTDYSYSYYDLYFNQPGWYKIYCSEDKNIGHKAAYFSGANTKIRSPK